MHCEELKSSCGEDLALLMACPSLPPTTGKWVSQVSQKVLLPTSQVGVGCHPTDTCSSDGCVLWSQHPAQSPGQD